MIAGVGNLIGGLHMGCTLQNVVVIDGFVADAASVDGRKILG